MKGIRFVPPNTAQLIAAADECARLLRRNPALPEGLAANACLVAVSARRAWLPLRRFGSAQAVIKRLTAVEIADCAERAYCAGIPQGGIDTLKKSWRVRRTSGCAGSARANSTQIR